MDDIRWSIRSLRMFLKHYGSQGEDQIICISEVDRYKHVSLSIEPNFQLTWLKVILCHALNQKILQI